MSEATVEGFLTAEKGEVAQIARRLVDEGEVEPLVGALLGEVTSGAAWRRARALERVRALPPLPPLLQALEKSLRDAGDAERRNGARSILAVLARADAAGEDGSLAFLVSLLRDEEPDVRLLAATALGESGNPRSRPALEETLRDPVSNVVAAAADALGILGDPRSVPALCRAAESGDFWIRAAIVSALGQLRDPRAIPVLTRAAEEEWLAEVAVTALGEIGDAAALPVLQRAVEQGSGPVRDSAIRAAGSLLSSAEDEPAPDWLVEALQGREEALREEMWQGNSLSALLLGVTGSARAAEMLLACAASPDSRPVAVVGLHRLPAPVALEAILERLPASEGERSLLLGALPPLPDTASAAAVLPYLGSSDREIRAAAVEALGHSPEEVVLPLLRSALEEGDRRCGAALALGRLGGAGCRHLIDLVRDEDRDVRLAAAEGLGRCDLEEVQLPLLAALEDETDDEVRRALVRALGGASDREVVARLTALTHDESAATRYAAVHALGGAGPAEALAPLLDALEDPEPGVRAAALHALGRLGDPRAVEPVAGRLGEAHRDLRREAAFALREIAAPEAERLLMAALSDPDREVRIAAIRTLEGIGAPAAREPLRRLADSDPDAVVRRSAVAALQQLEVAPTREER